jgi:hypothetical protein
VFFFKERYSHEGTIYLGIYYNNSMFFILCLLTFVSVYSINIEHVAEGCVRLIQPPSADSDIDMLKRTLDVNCLKYYNVHVEKHVEGNLTDLYQRSIDAAVRYEDSYTANEHTQYITKSWLSMVAADPLSLVQRQAKECNSHLLKSFFGNEDILRSGPVFLKSLDYMVQCFNDTYAFAQRQKEEFMEDFDYRVESVVNASTAMNNAYQNMTLEHDILMDYRSEYRRSIIVSFEKLFG